MKQELEDNIACQTTLIAALADPARYPHPATSVEKLETHISTILLAGDYAYKIKKPLDLGFLDFTSLERRKYYCFEELRLNRRLAPELYLDCIPICGSPENPLLGGDPQSAMEYALKMLRFPQGALLNRCLAEGRLEPRHLDGLARQLAEFHASIARADATGPLGSPERIQQPALDNFRDSRALLTETADLDKLAALERWTINAYENLYGIMATRKADGFIRECHGDLHLGNMILKEDQIVIFDCIEFNDDFRWIDVMNDLAFLYMDLYRRGAPALAQRLLNTYLEFSGDFAGLMVFPYYLVYRAMVRTKIAAIRLSQEGLDPIERNTVQTECRAYLDLALDFTNRPAPFLLITHGVSGSGKSHLSGQLLERLGAIRIRSDVERKRLFGLGPLDDSASALNQGIYTSAAGIRAYDRLHELAKQILAAGYPVLVDATFLEPAQRHTFHTLAQQTRVPFVLLACQVEPAVLRERIVQRLGGGDATEADIAVLEQQLAHYHPPSEDERPLDAGDGNIEALSRAISDRVRVTHQT